MEIKIKWIPRKQMTHENTYRDDISKRQKQIKISLLPIQKPVREFKDSKKKRTISSTNETEIKLL